MCRPQGRSLVVFRLLVRGIIKDMFLISPERHIAHVVVFYIIVRWREDGTTRKASRSMPFTKSDRQFTIEYSSDFNQIRGEDRQVQFRAALQIEARLPVSWRPFSYDWIWVITSSFVLFIYHHARSTCDWRAHICPGFRCRCRLLIAHISYTAVSRAPYFAWAPERCRTRTAKGRECSL